MATQGGLPDDLLVNLDEDIETELVTEKVTSQSYEGLHSSLSSVKEIDITIGNAENEELSQIQTSLRRLLTGLELTLIRLDRPSSIEESGPTTMSKETNRRLGLLVSNPARRGITLFGVSCGSEETVIDLVQSSTRLMSSNLYVEKFSGSVKSSTKTATLPALKIWNCKLNAKITTSLWSQLCNKPPSEIDISDSSLSFLPSPPVLPSVYTLKVKGATSQSYEGLLSSLPFLGVIDITMDDAERDVSQITAGLRRALLKAEDIEQKTKGKKQKLTQIHLRSRDLLPPEKEIISRDTMDSLGRLIKEQTKNLKELTLTREKCTKEEDLIKLIECCRHVKAMENVVFRRCGTKEGGDVESHLKSRHSSRDQIAVAICHDDTGSWKEFQISHIIQ